MKFFKEVSFYVTSTPNDQECQFNLECYSLKYKTKVLCAFLFFLLEHRYRVGLQRQENSLV